MKKGSRLHRRNMEMTTYEGEEGCIVMEGVLKEERLVDVTGMDGTFHPAGTFHHMIVRLNIRLASMTIEAVEVEMPETPRDTCRETEASMQRLKGLSVAPGFTREVIRRIGGARGCSHMRNLALAMGPAILQGFWVHRMRNPDTREPTDDLARKYLIDTCWLWRKDGPLAKEMEAGDSSSGTRH